MNNEDYVKENLKKDFKPKNNRPISVVLIGVGPHAKRIYLNYFRKYKINLALVVELDSQKDATKKYLSENGFKNTKLFTIDDIYKDDKHLSNQIFNNLSSICQVLEITHMIISTEPKAHFMYLEFALKNNINVLTDKPITVTKNMTSLASIEKVRNQYYEILKLAETSTASCNVMCQRQYHKGYIYIKNLLNEIVNKYQIPITEIEIYHCDGSWEFPHDMLKENHPYKYGYGKLYHSGYHFIDLLSDFIKINEQLSGSKKITKGEVYSNCFTPDDEMNICNIDDYFKIFKNQTIPVFYHARKQKNSIPKFKKFGEKNFYGVLDFYNNFNQLITHVNLNLLHYGFSRRGWIETKNFYKENGRVRHERLNIQVGSLLNIQVHSYQSKEIKDRTDDSKLEEEVGGLEHFDIDIYRNVDIIGGKPFERITLGSLYSDREKKNMLGYNELAREVYLTNFFKGNCEKGNIRNQELAIEILYSCTIGIHNHYAKIKENVPIKIKNKCIYPININNLNKYSNRINFDESKSAINHYEVIKEYEISIISNYLTIKKRYEVYITIGKDDEIASMLLYKDFRYKLLSKLYFFILKNFISYCTIRKLIEKIVK